MLQGIKILDLSRIIVGPYASMILADMGCEVIKVQSPQGDPTRTWGPPWHQNTSTYFLSINRNKRSIVLDLKNNASRQVLYKLASKSDAFIENFIPGTTQRLKIDYQTIQKYNPQIIYCSISGYGDFGPLKNCPAFDNTIQAQSGLMYLTGGMHTEPFKVGLAITDVVTGLYAANAVTAALFSQKNTGKGIHLKTSLYECAVASLINQGSNYLNGNFNPQRLGNHHPNIVPYGLYETKDDPIIICVGTANQYNSLLTVLNLAKNQQYSTNASRVIHRKQFDVYLNKALKEYSSQFLIRQFRQHSIPCSIVNSIKKTLQSSLAKQLNIVQNVDSVKLVRSPIRYDDPTLKTKIVKPPTLNQHGIQILQQLGYQKNEIINFFKGMQSYKH